MTIAQLFFRRNRKTAVTTVLRKKLIKNNRMEVKKDLHEKLDLIKVVIACTKSGLQNC
jgi:hypothetical protein